MPIVADRKLDKLGGGSMAGKFKCGDIVRLKSVGPEMTVKDERVDYQTKAPLGLYECQWFAGKKLESGVFPEDSLETAVVKAAIPAPGGV